MNLVFAAFTHGAALPILFPITWFGILNNFVTERFLLAYYYRAPPMFDNELNRQALLLLRLAPLSGLAMGYWYLGNRQIFFNEWALLEDAFGEMVGAKHYLFDYTKGPSHTLPILLALPCMLFFEQFLRLITLKLLPCIGCLRAPDEDEKAKADRVKANEDLGYFWECLSGIAQMRWYAQEHHFRKVLEIARLDDASLERLRTSKRKRKLIVNICDFDILKNERYSDSFLYTPLDRRFEADDSDIVARILLAQETGIRRAASGQKREETEEDKEQDVVNMLNTIKFDEKNTF